MDPDLLELARVRPVTSRLRTLLTPHKIALRAIETQAAGVTREHVLGADSSLAAVTSTQRHLRSVHLVSSRLAKRHLASEFQIMGLNPPESVPTPGSSYLNRLGVDLRPALTSPDRLTLEVRAERAALAAAAAANRAYTDTQLLGYRAAMLSNDGFEIRKMWITNENLATPPCPLCRGLNGKIVALDDEFPIVGPAPYVDLLGPPRHPWCRCRIIPRMYRLDTPPPEDDAMAMLRAVLPEGAGA